MSEILVDTLTGKTTATTLTIGSTPMVSASANSLTVRGEGSNQTSVQQGLAKSWSAVNGQGTIAVLDSFNTASILDTNTGVHQVNYTTAMSNANYAAAVSHQESQRNNAYGSHATTSIRSFSRSDSGTYSDVANKSVMIFGDLA